METQYLDVDDEITDAVARLRASGTRQLAFVLQPGSRIATSRINFRLLAREAAEREMTLAVVSGESGVRALAIAAGLPAYTTLAEAETALGEDGDATRGFDRAATPGEVIGKQPDSRRPPLDVMSEPGAAGLGASAAARLAREGRASADLGPTPATPVVPAPSPRGRTGTSPRGGATDDAGGLPAAGTAPAIASDRRTIPSAESLLHPNQPASARPARHRRRLLIALLAMALLALVVGGGVAAAYLWLPNATIEITPRSQVAGPVELTVVADPDRRVADPGVGEVPAESLEIPLEVSAQFTASGVEVVESRASGTVRFESQNTVFDVTVPAGTRISTEEGVSFVTAAALELPQASFATGPTSATVEIEALDPGPIGNVPAGSITQVSDELGTAQITVTNPDATTGGERLETQFVNRRDYEGAVEALRPRLAEQLITALADPATTPEGLTLFPQTAERGEISVSPAQGELVGQTRARFRLTLTSRANVIAVDESQLEGLAETVLRESVPEGYQLFEDSVRVSVGRGQVEGDTVRYTLEASAEQWRPLDERALRAQVLGATIEEARQILDDAGAVEITAWPDFVDRIPTDERRVELTVLPPQRGGG